MDEKKIQILKNLLAVVDTKSTSDELLKTFKIVVDIFQKMKQANTEDKAKMLQMVENKLSEMENSHDEMVTGMSDMKKQMMNYCESEMAKMMKDHDTETMKIDKKLSQVKNGENGTHGEDGKQGLKGDIPDHEWDGTKLRFERPDGTWGEWVDLKGATGNNYSLLGGGGNSSVFGSIHIPRHEAFTMNGTDTFVTLSQGVSAGGTAIWARYQGQSLDLTSQFTVSGNKVTFVGFVPEVGTIISITYIP